MSTGSPLATISEAVARATKKVEDEEKPVSARIHLDAWKRDLARKDGLGGLALDSARARLASLVAQARATADLPSLLPSLLPDVGASRHAVLIGLIAAAAVTATAWRYR